MIEHLNTGIVRNLTSQRLRVWCTQSVHKALFQAVRRWLAEGTPTETDNVIEYTSDTVISRSTTRNRSAMRVIWNKGIRTDRYGCNHWSVCHVVFGCSDRVNFRRYLSEAVSPLKHIFAYKAPSDLSPL